MTAENEGMTNTYAHDIYLSEGLMQNLLYDQDFISIKNLSLEKIELILETAARFKEKSDTSLLKDKIIAHCFFEPSTRTRLSFETATLRLGGKVIGFASDEGLSIQKGESLSDTMRVISSYADCIVIRHPKEGAAQLAADVSSVPVINAGDGANQHPTQSLVDLFTIKSYFKQLHGLSIALVGDLKYGRTIHSFVEACLFYGVRLYLVAPDSLSLPSCLCDKIKTEGLRFSFHQSISEIISKVDVIYMTRFQEERYLGHLSNKLPYQLTLDMLEKAQSHLKILHPLPRVHEIDMRIDKTEHAAYFQQVANGIPVRQALLSLLLNENVS